MIRGFIPLPVFLAILAWIYWRIVVAFKPFRKRRYILLGIFLLFPVCFILLGMSVSLNDVPLLIRINGFLMGFLLIVTIPIVIELVLSALWPKRRKMFVSMALVLALIMTGWGMVNGLAVPVVEKMELRLPDWPKELAGLRIAFLADLHLGGAVSVKWLEDTVEQVNAADPDLIVIAGDLVGGLSNRIDRYRPALKKLSAPLGVWSSRGNHEFDNGGRTFRKLLKGTNIKVLENRNVVLANGLQLAGVDDPRGKGSPDLPGGLDLAKALAGVTGDKPVILLSHRPGVFDNAAQWGVDLILAGHTHAGQFPPPSWVTALAHHYLAGEFLKRRSRMLVTPGSGTWEYLPLRIGSRNLVYLLRILREVNG